MRLACLTRYGNLGASSRVRCTQYWQPLTRALPALDISRQALLDDSYLRRKYAGRSVVGSTLRCYAARALSPALRDLPDLWWIEKELWPYLPAGAETALLRRRPYVLDLDDAIFHNYDLHRSRTVRRLLGRKIDQLMAGAALVTAGSDYLAERARNAGAKWVELLPTVIDLDRYRSSLPTPGREAPNVLTVGWIGSPATTRYLQQLAGPLERLARERPLRLVVVGGSALSIRGVDVVQIAWSHDSEVNAIAGFDIGVMPLADSPWERGKCGYKLIQYMACGIPVVASPIGVNCNIVREGVNGLLASNADDWYEALKRLAADPAERSRLGAAGRARVEAEYCVQVTAPRLARWLQAVASQQGY